MAVRLENRCQRPISFTLERRICKFLRKVPPEHLIGLAIVILADVVSHKGSRKRGALGIYRQKYQQQPCAIELVPQLIYRGMPRSFFYLPFLADFVLASVLYHEIGHHYHVRFVHGVRKQQREDFANEYRNKMLMRVFRRWLMVLRPLWPLIRWLRTLVATKDKK